MPALDKWSNPFDPQFLCVQGAAEDRTGLRLGLRTIPGAKVSATVFSSLLSAGERAWLRSRPTGLGSQSCVQLRPPSCLHTPALESTPSRGLAKPFLVSWMPTVWALGLGPAIPTAG